MLAIRLRRAGSKNRPFYRVVVTESRSAREGRFVEVLGYYNPRTNPENPTRIDVATGGWHNSLRPNADQWVSRASGDTR